MATRTLSSLPCQVHCLPGRTTIALHSTFPRKANARHSQSPHVVLLLLLSHFSCVRLGATPETAAHQASQSLGFSRQEHWSGLPSPSPMCESEKWKWSRSVVSDSYRPHGLQPTSSSIHGIFQARVLEWGALPSPSCGSTGCQLGGDKRSCMLGSGAQFS